MENVITVLVAFLMNFAVKLVMKIVLENHLVTQKQDIVKNAKTFIMGIIVNIKQM